MRHAAFGPLLLLAALAVAATASAGSRGHPEVTDPAGDGLDNALNQPVPNPDLDIVSAWFADADGGIEVHLRLADLATETYRDGRNGHDWTVVWEVGPRLFEVRIARDNLNPTDAALNELTPGVTGRATLVFRADAAQDEFVALVPRTGTFTGGATWDFRPGTTFTNPRAGSFDGPGTASVPDTSPVSGGCDTCTTIDRTAPGASFTVGATSATRPPVLLQPVAPVVAAPPGETTTVRFLVGSPIPHDFAPPFTATVDRANWTLVAPSATATLARTGVGEVAFQVAVPSGTPVGETATLRIAGALKEATALLVAGASVPAPLQRLADTSVPHTAPATTTPITFHLYGATQNAPNAPTYLSGDLVDASPSRALPASSVQVPLTAARTNLGEWRSAPLASPLQVKGTVTAEIFATWSDVSAPRVVALVGPSPLPTDWTASAPPPGTIRLSASGNGGAPPSTPTALRAAGHVEMSFAAGDRLAVGLYVERDAGSGQFTAHLFGTDAPSRLEVQAVRRHPAAPTLASDPATKLATVTLPVSDGRGAPNYGAITGTLRTESGATVPALASVHAVQSQAGNAIVQARGTSSPRQTFTGGSQGSVQTTTFTLDATTVRAVFRLAGDHGPDRTADNDLDLVIHKREDGARRFVKASRAPGPVESVVLSPQDLAAFGPGTYEADVVFDRLGSGVLGAVGYTVEATQEDGHAVRLAWARAGLVWNHSAAALGGYVATFDLPRANGTTEKVDLRFRLTDLGPTVPPLVEIAATPLAVISSENVTFTSAAHDPDGRIVRYRWDLGDGNTSSLPNATHAYARPGNYVVTLSVTDDMNATVTSLARTIAVANAPPVADFRVDPAVGTVGRPVRFQDASQDVDGHVRTWTWSFGDGETSTEAAPTHTYARSGTFLVRLAIRDDAGGQATVERPFIVVEDGTLAAEMPLVDFVAPLNPTAGALLRFQDETTFSGNGTLQYRWDFGDGTTSTERHATHRYEAVGFYRVTLTAWPLDRTDLSSSFTRVLSVTGTAIAVAFSADPVTPRAGETVAFADLTPGLFPNATRAWEFGDGSVATGPSVTHAFDRAGTYQVRLTVTEPGGRASSTLRALVVGAGGVAPPITNVDPSQGSVLRYREAYAAREAHAETYPASAADAELSGSRDREFLAAPDGQAVYVQGTYPRVPSTSSWAGARLLATNVAGAALTYEGGEATVLLGNAKVRAPIPSSLVLNGIDLSPAALSDPPRDRDDLRDGRLVAATTSSSGGVAFTRSFSLLEGTLHADLRTVVDAARTDEIALVTETVLTVGASHWLAHPTSADGVRAMPIAQAEGLLLAREGRTNVWLAVYRPDTEDVAGLVVSGDFEEVRVHVQGAEARVTVTRRAMDDLVAAEYLVVYKVGDLNATRYAGVREVARQDAEEIGVAFLDDDRAAAAAWVGSGARIALTRQGVFSGAWAALNGASATYTMDVEADASQGGKALRAILPAGKLRDQGLQLAIDGVALSPLDVDAAQDEDTLLLVIPIDHFSLRTVRIQTVVPGVSPVFLWLTLALGTVAGLESLTLGRQLLLRSRAAGRASGGVEVPDEPAGGAPPPPKGPRSAAARRALGLQPLEEPPLGYEKGQSASPVPVAAAGDAEQAAYKSALLRKLQAEAGSGEIAGVAGAGVGARAARAAGSLGRTMYAPCKSCEQPIRFEPGSRLTTCPRCGVQNVRDEN